MADFGVFAKFAISQHCGHFQSRRLRQNVLQGLHFKRILIRRQSGLRRGDFQAPEVGLLLQPFSLGPPYEESQKMADFGVFAKFAISQHCGHFQSRRLRQNVLQGLHFKRILIRRQSGLRRGDFQAPEVGLLFWPFSLGPPYEESQKMADFGVFAKFAISQHCGHFQSRRLRQNVLQGLHFKRILIRRQSGLRRGDFQAPEVGLLFQPFSLGPPYEESQKMADFGVFAKFAISQHCGHFQSRRLRQNVLQGLHFKRILIRRQSGLRRGDFQAPEVGLLFQPFSLGPPYEESQKMADFGVFAKFAISQHCGHFQSRRLRQNVLQGLHFKRILIRRQSGLRRGDFQAPEVGLLFWPFSLGPPYEESQKMADFGVFAKFAISQHCGHFQSRRLRQNVLQGLHFKRILIRRQSGLRRGDFQAPEVGLLFQPFSLGPPYEESQKMADFGVFAKFAISQHCGHFQSRRLRQNVLQGLHFKRILIRRQSGLRRGDFQAPEVGLLFWPSRRNLALPAVKTDYRNSFAYTGAKIWNALPDEMKYEKSMRTFKRKLESLNLSIDFQ